MRIIATLALTASILPAWGAGGMTFHRNVNSVRPDHSSMAGTNWGWNFRTNLSPAQSFQPNVVYGFSQNTEEHFLDITTHANLLNNNFVDPSEAGTTGYMAFERKDNSISFQTGSSMRILLRYAGGSPSLVDSPVPGMMMGLQDKNGKFFGVGFASDGGSRYIRMINNPFTGAGTEWIAIPNNSTFFGLPGSRELYNVELMIAGSRASVFVNGTEIKDSNSNLITLGSGAPLNSLIFSPWGSPGGAIVGDYCTTSSGTMGIYSLSYY